MRLNEIKIKNYRNLDGVRLKLNSETNFLVGENDLGKSNFLELLEKIFNGQFYESDFDNKDNNIHVTFSISFSDSELGLFEDLFNPKRYNEIDITAEMGIMDDYIKYSHTETGEKIQKSDLRCVNFIKYNSLRKPSDELDFYKKRGVGRLLHFMVKEILEDTVDSQILNDDFIDNIIEEINDYFKRIRIFEEFGIDASPESDPIDLFSRIVKIKDSKGMPIGKIGHGIQFSVLIVLSILEKLMNIMETKLLEKCIFEKDGIKSISLILGLDEPEIHLHPYRQRNLIKYVTNLINNREEGFSSLIKDIFGIDQINGQSIVVTHSPNILTNDYMQISRFYKKNGLTQVKSGSDIYLSRNLRKQLLKNIPYVKEAFFSRCNIIVEGDSELGALPIFAERMGLDLDKLGISVIQAGGVGSIPNISILLNKFGIKNVGIMDGDVFNSYESEIKENNLNVYSTAYEDFEEDWFKSFAVVDYTKFMEENFGTKSTFAEAAKKLGKTIDMKRPIHEQINSFSKLEKYSLKKSITVDELRFLRKKKNKSIIMGMDVAESIPKIPGSYMNLLKKARRLADE